MKLIRFSIIALAITGFLFTGCTKESTPPTPIVVNAGPSQTIQLPADSITLTATIVSGQSSMLVYSWTLLVGPNSPTILNGNTTIATVKGLIAGTYIFEFEATNGTGTVIGLDTVGVKVSTAPTLTNTQLLVQQAWEPQNVLFQIGSTGYSYSRGGVSNVPPGDDFDNQRFTFNADGTGILSNSPGTYSFTWAFAPGDETKMTVTVNYVTKVLTFNWSFVQITQNSLIYTQEYVDGGIEVLSQNLYIPAP